MVVVMGNGQDGVLGLLARLLGPRNAHSDGLYLPQLGLVGLPISGRDGDFHPQLLLDGADVLPARADNLTEDLGMDRDGVLHEPSLLGQGGVPLGTELLDGLLGALRVGLLPRNLHGGGLPRVGLLRGVDVKLCVRRVLDALHCRSLRTNDNAYLLNVDLNRNLRKAARTAGSCIGSAGLRGSGFLGTASPLLFLFRIRRNFPSVVQVSKLLLLFGLGKSLCFGKLSRRLHGGGGRSDRLRALVVAVRVLGCRVRLGSWLRSRCLFRARWY
mmetsp:Transcript_30064/g.89323  ORF Transcript_30064/g.89323 Transcript_30064/m.89323 type:complete len:271 (-) Transcript_30064:626-1438(-)